MAFSKMCSSAHVLMIRRGPNISDCLPRSTAEAEVQRGTLVFWRDPADLGFRTDIHELRLRIEEITVVLLQDTDASVIICFGDAAHKLAPTAGWGADEGDDEDDVTAAADGLYDWRQSNMMTNVKPLRGKKGETIQMCRPNDFPITNRHCGFATCRKGLMNLALILRDAHTGDLVNAEVYAKITFTSNLKDSD
jgi:hypothetical protein